MKRIGLTGGIGSGKSTVSRRLAELGAVVIDADQLAREVVEPGTEGLQAITAAFGDEVLLPDGALNRPALGKLVFADAAAREKLNSIVHPLVRARSAELISAAPQNAIVVEDIPLLVETGQAARFDLVVVVDAEQETQIERLVRDRHLSREEALARINAQATREQRGEVAGVVLSNDGSLEELLDEVDWLWENLGE